ncbi:actin-binding Rho-activating protein-like [Tubulanus polymorphus]|uniref:actin-binding Rho-activating protein-like n=1 Tax=Tubulanus polymorphus TaxID=672921 RepID=UPI003DA552CA
MAAPTSWDRRALGKSKGVTSRISQWNKKADEHHQKQLINPFSEWQGASHRDKLSKDDPDYGKPVAGSSTERRGQQAGSHISREIIELCEIISDVGERQRDGTWCIRFGTLFDTYTKISNKLVGMLMRARKQRLIDFEGEMLFQRRDDEVLIHLLVNPFEFEEIN